ncbi:MAG: NHLP family bacteriocin export ABC transporter peptidase/permease/ATPase subunit [Pseudodesulfovibrio sp.]
MSEDKPLWKNKRVRTPTVIQMEALECGAAALCIVLAYHGLFVPLEQLREECGVNRDGSKAGNILRAARARGMQAVGYRMEPSHLNTVELPVILFWNFNHFVVLEGIRNKKVFLNDPATGPKVVTWEEFDQAFTGVTLVLEPGPDFRTGGEKPSVLRALRRRLTIGRAGMAFAVLAGLAMVLPGLVIPIFSKVFVDNVLVNGSRDWLKPLLLGMVLTGLLRAALTWLQGQALLRQQTKLAVISSAHFFRHILRLPMSFFSQRYGGEIGSRVGLNDTVAGLLTGTLASTCISIVTAVFFAAIMLLYDSTLTAIGVLFALVNIVVLRWVNRKRADLQQRVLQENGKLSGTAMGGLRLIETIKASSSESDFFARFSGQVAKFRNALQDMNRWTSLVMPIPALVSGLSTAAILGLGSLKVMDGQMTIGTLVAFQSLMASFLSPFNSIVQLGTELQTLQGDMNRLDDVMKHREDPIYQSGSRADANKGIRLSGRMEIRGLAFGYSRLDPPLIKDFDLTLAPGSRVALVGGSGSGKSTVAKLVSGLYEPWTGDVLFDGRPMREVAREVFLNSFSFVDQEIVLFQGTVRDNLTMWNPAIPQAQVVRAAKDARIHDVIAARPGGYAAPLDENGANLSGGQRQRIEIARALASDPAILVLDEATSALDAETEKIIDDNLRRRGCTCLIVAHRLSTIRDCDEIVVMERGKIVQRGRHDDMMREDGPYRRLIES